MTFVCIECGTEFEYQELMRNKLKCNRCQVKRNNIWIKQRPDTIAKSVIAR